MGQRHQAFIVAKVKPHGSSTARYRCIAAYHSQWCYGTLPLRAAYRVLSAVKQPENAEVIREELRSIDGKYGCYRQKPSILQVPCPFIATILANNWDIDLSPKSVYFSGVSLENAMLHAGMHKWGGGTYPWPVCIVKLVRPPDNNDGITIIDVTNPDDPVYGFYSGETPEPENAEKYIRHYYAVPGRQQEPDTDSDSDSDTDTSAARAKAGKRYEKLILKAIGDLQDAHVLDPSAVQKVWLSEEAGGSYANDSNAGVKTGAGVPPPVDISLHKSIEQAIVKSQDTSALEDLHLLPEKMGIVDDALRALSPFPDAAVPLLMRLVKERNHQRTSLNLAGYPLTATQTLGVAADLPEVNSVNLSRNDALTVADIRQLLEGLPSLNRLILINCPSVESSELITLAHDVPELFRHLYSLLHPAFMRIPLPPKRSGFVPMSSSTPSDLPVRMTVVTFMRSWPPSQGVSFPFVSPAAAVQGLTDFATGCTHDIADGLFMSGGRAIEVAFAGLPRAPGMPWHARGATMPLPLEIRTAFVSEGWVLVLEPPQGLGPGAGYAFLRLRPDTAGEEGMGEEKEKKEDAKDSAQAASQGGEEAKSGLDQKKEDVSEEAGVFNSSEDASEPSTSPPTSQKDSNTAKQSKARSHVINYELHDLRGFLRTTEQEGYLSVPENSIAALEALIQKMRWPVYSREQVDALILRRLRSR